VFNQRSNEVKQVLFLHIDVDKQRELAGRAGVQVVPTFVAYHNGQKVRVDTGSRTGLVDDLLSKLLKPQ
jgi:thioredoxin-like negative regulator of GroEL